MGSKRKLAVFDNTLPDANSPQARSLIAAALSVGAKAVDTSIFGRDADSERMLPYWDKTDDIVDGLNAIRSGGSKYLPRFDGELDAEYRTRLTFTKMTNVYRDIVETIVSKPFEQEVMLVDREEDIAEDIDGAGNNLTMFSNSLFFHGLNSAIAWIFVDYPNVTDDRVRTVNQARDENIRPFWSIVLGRNVLSAKWQMINSKSTLVYIRILEQTDEGDRVRVFKREPATGLIIWELWKRNEKKEAELIEIGSISIPVIPLVPFITGRRRGNTMNILPALRDAADLQIDLYEQESGLKYLRTVSAYPMLNAEGVTPEREQGTGAIKPVPVGPMRILYGGINPTSGTAGRWEFIQPSADVMNYLKADIKETMDAIREVGKQPLTAQSGNLTTISAAVAASKSKSAAQNMAANLKDTLENAWVITYMWLGKPIETAPSVYVFDEFDNFIEGAQDIQQLREMRKDGDLTQKTYWEELKRRKVLSNEFTAERERKRQMEEIPGDVVREEEEI